MELHRVLPFPIPVRMTWARLLKRVFDRDIAHCWRCDKLKLVAVLEEPDVIEKILNASGGIHGRRRLHQRGGGRSGLSGLVKADGSYRAKGGLPKGKAKNMQQNQCISDNEAADSFRRFAQCDRATAHWGQMKP